MRLNRLSIKRFGIFWEEKLEDIGAGIVVIGGHNRAGKSTFLQIIKNLRGGFHRVPFENRAEFAVNADLCVSPVEMVNLSIEGLAEPKMVPLTGQRKNYSLDEIYNNIDQFTYSRLFVISLEELQKIPTGLENRETERLQSILLGAGLAEMLYLPQIEAEFANEADKLGGKRGKANVRTFKPYNDSIREALELKNEALSATDEYYKKREKQQILCRQIQELEENVIPARSMEYTKIETLSHVYNFCATKLRLESDLEKISPHRFPSKVIEGRLTMAKVADFSEKLKEIDESYNNRLDRFRQKIGKGLDIAEVKQKILTNSQKINHFYHALSGLKARTASFIAKRQKHLEEVQNIKNQMNSTNQAWKGEFENIEKINSDQIEWDKLNRTLEGLKKTRLVAEELEEELEQISAEKQIFEGELTAINSSAANNGFKNYLLISIIIALGSVIGAVFIEPFLGIFTLMGIAGIIIFSVNKINTSKRTAEKVDDLEMKINIIGETAQKREAKKAENQKIKDEYEKDVENYILLLKLEKDVSIDMIKEYFREVQFLKNRIMAIKRSEMELNDELADLQVDYGEIREIINDTYAEPTINWKNFDELLVQKEICFQQMEKLKETLDLAEELALGAKSRIELRAKIQDYCGIGKDEENIFGMLNQLQQDIGDYQDLQKSKAQIEKCNDRILFEIQKEPIREAFDFTSNNQNEGLEILTKYYMAFSSQDDVNFAKNLMKKELTDLHNKLAAVKKELQGLEIELKHLATTDKIEKAQKDIRGRRLALLPLAEKYATYRAAEYILGNVRERIIAKTKNKSLKPAGEIFRLITSGEYSTIMPADELIKADFKAVLDDQAIQNSVDVLSRGTREQLFFAVRVSRIKEMDPLPVVIDDSLVNFDTRHLQQVIRVIKDLSATNQIFILTSHSKMVSMIAEQIEFAQYWKLEKGRFSRSAKSQLISYLG